jgi:hypothetical protein
MKIHVWVAAASIAVCSVAFADTKKDAPKPAAPAAAQQQQQMSPQQQAEMEAMMKAMTPGPQHKMLDGMVGDWNAKVSMWMQPGAPPASSEGTSENRWILGGRYVEQKFNGSVMGQPFSGVGYTGYDNVKKQYWGTWIDSMSTSIMHSTGSTTDGKAWTFTSTMADPLTGKDAPVEERINVVDADHHVWEMWSPGPDGKMFKMMEITYSRKK